MVEILIYKVKKLLYSVLRCNHEKTFYDGCSKQEHSFHTMESRKFILHLSYNFKI